MVIVVAMVLVNTTVHPRISKVSGIVTDYFAAVISDYS